MLCTAGHAGLHARPKCLLQVRVLLCMLCTAGHAVRTGLMLLLCVRAALLMMLLAATAYIPLRLPHAGMWQLAGRGNGAGAAAWAAVCSGCGSRGAAPRAGSAGHVARGDTNGARQLNCDTCHCHTKLIRCTNSSACYAMCPLLTALSQCALDLCKHYTDPRDRLIAPKISAELVNRKPGTGEHELRCRGHTGCRGKRFAIRTDGWVRDEVE